MQQLAQDPELLQVVRLDQQLLAAGAGAVDVDRRVHPLLGDAAVQVHFQVAGALELLVDRQHYNTHDHDAQFLVIERADLPVGRLTCIGETASRALSTSRCCPTRAGRDWAVHCWLR
jgi:hypothetical protein